MGVEWPKHMGSAYETIRQIMVVVKVEKQGMGGIC